MTTFRKNSPFGGILLFQIFRVIRSFDLAIHAEGLAAHALSVPDFSAIGWISTLRHSVRFCRIDEPSHQYAQESLVYAGVSFAGVAQW